MQYMLLIYSGDAPEKWDSLSEDEQNAIMGEYFAISQSPGVTGGNQLQPVETATTVRVDNGSTLTTDGPFAETKEALGGYYLIEADDLDAALEVAARIPGGAPGRRGRGAAGGGALSDPRRCLPRRVGAGARHPDRLPRRLRPRRGGRSGGLRGRRRALAARRDAREPRRVARSTTARNRADRPDPPRPHARGQDASCSRCPRPWRTSRLDETDDPRRAPRADLHLLPPGAGDRGAGRADPAHARRADHDRDRPGVPGPRADDGPAPRARQAQDQAAGHPVPRAARRTCCRSGSPPCSPSST